MKNKTSQLVFSISFILVVALIIFFFLKTDLVKDKTSFKGLSENATRSGATGSFSNRLSTAEQNSSVDPWEVWIDKQTDIQLEILLKDIKKAMPYAYEDAKKSRNHLRAQVAERLKLMASKLQEDFDTPPPLKKYNSEDLPRPPEDENSGIKRHEGPQTADAIMETFSGMLDQHSERDKKYPEAEWIQMLLNRGITIEDTKDYFGYQHARFNLLLLEQQPEQWTSGILGIEPTEDWETFKTDYINKKIWEYEMTRAAAEADPTITSGLFVGKNGDQFLPFGSGRVYVKRDGGSAVFNGAPLTDEQRFNILFKGEHPEGYTIIYLDNDDNILNEPPPPVTREDLMPPENWPSPVLDEGFTPQETMNDMDIGTTEHFMDPGQHIEDVEGAAQREFERRQKEFIERSRMTTEEVNAILEGNFDADFSFEKSIETQLREQFDPDKFSPTRVNSAIETLNRYGPTEGLRKLTQSDPEIAKQIQRKLQNHPPPPSHSSTEPLQE